jgi:site-specific DNA-methyltransferase (adenine-specific)
MKTPYVRTMLGDCLERMKEIEDGSIDLILCDLPYGTTACKWDSVIPFEPLWAQYRRLLKSRGQVVLTASQPFTSALVMSNPEWFRVEWVWEKNRGSNFASTKWHPMKEHESVLVFGSGAGTYNAILQKRADRGKRLIASGGIKSKGGHSGDVYGGANKGYDNSTRDPVLRVPRSIQRFNIETGFHPTQKPVALMEYMVRTYTNEGDTVLDNCMGSGTTGVACINLRRNFVGIEKERKYYDIAVKRMRAAKKEKYV